MNFNYTKKNEYALNNSLVTEMINLYGVPTKLLIVEEINQDNVFGDYSHLKTNNSDIYEMYMLPEQSEDWETDAFEMGSGYMTNFDNITLFVAKSNFDNILEVNEITGNLLVFPNNKIMEITYTDATTPGINNLFTESDAKTVYKLTCKPYAVKLTDELNTEDISVDESNYETLDDYFQELLNDETIQDDEAEVVEYVETVQTIDNVDTTVKEPFLDNSEDDVWGKFN